MDPLNSPIFTPLPPMRPAPLHGEGTAQALQHIRRPAARARTRHAREARVGALEGVRTLHAAGSRYCYCSRLRLNKGC